MKFFANPERDRYAGLALMSTAGFMWFTDIHSLGFVALAGMCYLIMAAIGVVIK